MPATSPEALERKRIARNAARNAARRAAGAKPNGREGERHVFDRVEMERRYPPEYEPRVCRVTLRRA